MHDSDPTAEQPHPPVVTPASAASAASAATATALPQQIGRYRIDKVLGRGGFGLVYLAHDGQLQRLVAIKVPHSKLVGRPQDAEAYLTEARTVASLDHPHIVSVHDVGSTDDYPCFIVSKYIDGTDLATRLKQSRLSPFDAVGLVATVAEALHFAHKQGLVHRDVKPGNILLDRSGQPFVADFGLALREQDVGTGPGFAGTPAYMSPEQARGEGHRVDGRSDVFSLGVVFYELLVGRRPFKADSQAELLEQIASFEPRPPRQYDDAIPKELERICLRALSKRAAERYSTAKDMADDLRHFLTLQPGPALSGSGSTTPAPLPQPPSTRSDAFATRPAPTSDNRPIKIVPKGLRSFDAHDADFFLELLPGPRDRDGLPDGIRFWKIRIEETDPDNTFAVGLIYGPSGCGKSSLVRAGLLPRLSGDVTAVYVEAAAEETETRLLNGLRKRCATAPSHLGLKETVAELRRTPGAKKVLIVLDQFEQWLHANTGQQGTELVQALRQCDGGRVQCVVMVRDDFWMAATRFMRELDVRLLEGQNSAPVDLFPARHAEKVLAAFGRCFGALPEAPAEVSEDQKRFLKQAVAGLAQEDKVVPVRLALFAEMMKGRTWSPAALKEVGGTAGVGVTFLEETFGAPTAPPEHRYHQKAARGVLTALLPEAGTDIKGHMRSSAELLSASGYGSRPKDFDDLIRVLDREVRLITPVDPEGEDESAVRSLRADERYYQLAHDYLVPALRDWLTRKRKETRRGRAELLLAERAGVWSARPQNRHLPSWWEWARIRLFTRKRDWTPTQRAMMGRAFRFRGTRVAGVVAVIALLSLGGWEYHSRSKAHALRDRLLTAVTADVPGIVEEMAPHRRRLEPLLREADADAQATGNDRRRLHLSLALLPSDSGQVEYLYGRLLEGHPEEFATVRQQLASHGDRLTDRLWAELETPYHDPERRFRAACALAAYAPSDPRWANFAPFVVTKLVTEPPLFLSAWAAALRPVGSHLLAPLATCLADENGGPSRRRTAVALYREFAADQDLARLEAALAVSPVAGADGAKHRANLGVALLVLGRGEKVWPLLAHTPAPTVRGYLIERLASGGADPRILEARLKTEQDVSVRRALILALGGFEFGSPSAEQLLLDLYGNDPDPGVHSAAEWTLRRWGRANPGAALRPPGTGRAWFLTPTGQTMAVVPPGQIRVRSRVGKGEEWRELKVDHRFAIATTEVTVEEFQKFRREYKLDVTSAPDPRCPANSVSWYAAAAYCNWLSKKEGLPDEELCYRPNAKNEYADGMGIAPDYLTRKGYRLPTVAEWTFAAAAGAETKWPCGDLDLVPGYSWFRPMSEANSVARSWPVGGLKPNDLGLFDMFGNVAEWCQDEIGSSKTAPGDGAEFVRPTRVSPRGVCGGDYEKRPSQAGTSGYLLDRADSILGFRPARTVR